MINNLNLNIYITILFRLKFFIKYLKYLYNIFCLYFLPKINLKFCKEKK